MFYKFLGGSEEALLDLFDRVVVEGSCKFSSPLHCNDPFEFKFRSVLPTESSFNEWHAEYEPDRSAGALENAWSNLSNDYITEFETRLQAMNYFYILCLTREWRSHLMWAHYGASHTGFVVCYRPSIIDALREMPHFCGDGDVRYSETVAEVKWFGCPPSEMFAPVFATKSTEWAYEKEYRIVLERRGQETELFVNVDSSHIAGVILGARASAKLKAKALKVQADRIDFTAEGIVPEKNSFALVAAALDARTTRFTHLL